MTTFVGGSSDDGGLDAPVFNAPMSNAPAPTTSVGGTPGVDAAWTTFVGGSGSLVEGDETISVGASPGEVWSAGLELGVLDIGELECAATPLGIDAPH